MNESQKAEPDDERDAAPASAKALLAEVWIDRDLGWIDFNRRVLAEVLDPRTPLLERAKFLAIFTANLDEFFMKRIAVLREKPTAARRAQITAIRPIPEPRLRATPRGAPLDAGPSPEEDRERGGSPAAGAARPHRRQMNQLEDPAMIAALCEASRAGVPIDLVVRGFCCLRPGVPGWSETIRVHSIIGRFLEHSRIFHFAAGSEDPLEGEFSIGSADWMYRNLSRRVEMATPVSGRGLREKLWEILEVGLRDERQAWILDSTGSYSRVEP